MDDRSDNLSKYRQKRDFTKTKEPEGIVAKPGGNRYLIQKHKATRLHYDFRLELDGVLKSWAVTRGPSPNADDKRLAVETEDHPVAYGTFEGTIPKGEYGGGTVMLWDEGTWEPIGDPREGLEKGDLKFILHGKRLHGSWVLARMKSRPEDHGRNNWLLIKHRDDDAFEEDAETWLEANATSIISARSMDEIAADADNVWHSGQGEDSRMDGGPEAARPSKARTSKPAKTYKPLKFMKPELATLADAVPEGPNWVHEIKFDGYRTMALIDQGEVHLLTRSGLDWTPKYQSIADELKSLHVGQVMIDGEIVAVNEAGASSFQKLKDELGAGRSENLQYYVFDCLVLDGEDLTRLPLLERKARLKALLERHDLHNRVIYSEHFAENAEFLPRVCSLEMEGIISKRADSIYSGRRGEAWLKVKCHKRQEFVIVGFTESSHAERGFRSLLLGYYDGTELKFAGKVGTGFNGECLFDIRKKLDALKVVPKPFSKLPPDVGRGIWVEPKLVCEVEFTEWTDEGRLRHPSFQGLREDKKAKDVHRDEEKPVAEAVKEAEVEVASEPAKKISSKTAKAPARPARGDSERVDVGGVSVSHPDRVVYPDTGERKLDLVQYYQAVASHMLPHVGGRPLSVLRIPDNITGEQFFQRHLPAHGGLHNVEEVDVPVKTRTEHYMAIEDELGLLSLSQWGVIEFHPWQCRNDQPTLPDRMIFDLDPDPGAPWENVIDGASEIRERMRELGLESFLKTTGGKGLHVVVPFERKFGFPTIKAFTRAIAESMAHDDSKRYITTMSKAKRTGKIFVDYLRNDITATAVSAFSVRARPGATVSTPLQWSELRPGLKPAEFNIHTVPERLAKQKSDPWADYFNVKQGINPEFLKALKIDPK
jgi:bifunctional non-homologous end joining protein LigD